jgi:hypothetical protein
LNSLNNKVIGFSFSKISTASTNSKTDSGLQLTKADSEQLMEGLYFEMDEKMENGKRKKEKKNVLCKSKGIPLG